MKLRLLSLISALSILLPVAVSRSVAQTQQRDNRPRTASISGRVTIAGKAAVNAKVTVIESDSGEANPIAMAQGGASRDVYNTITDANGRYRVFNLPDGKYEVRALLGSCVREKPAPNESLVESVSLDEGESRENVDFSLVRGGVITGRVTDAEGRPLIARIVSLQIVDEQGRKQETRSSPNIGSFEMFQTDDRGVYRIYALRAGRYLISAGGESDMGLMGLVAGAAGNYPRTWHPDTADENQAKVIEVAGGGEITGVDIRLGVAKKSYEAVGRVVDDETGKPIARAGVVCIKTKGDDAGFGGFGGNSKTDEQGNFRLNGLTPGQYQVVLANFDSFLMGGGGYYSDGARFEIQGADVAGVEIRARSGATISGVAVIEDADPSAKSSLSQIMIMAHSTSLSQNEGDAGAIAIGMMPTMSRIGSDGAFNVKGVRPGKVTFQTFSVTDRSLMIVRIERGGADVGDGIVVTGREEVSGVRIVFGKGSGVIRGQVRVVGGALPENWRMSVMTSNEKDAGQVSFSGPNGYAEVDDKGRFVIEGLLPGEYKLMLVAQPKINPNSPDLPAENMPAPITQKVVVTKGQETQVTMTLDLSKKGQEEK